MNTSREVAKILCFHQHKLYSELNKELNDLTINQLTEIMQYLNIYYIEKVSLIEAIIIFYNQIACQVINIGVLKQMNKVF